MRIWVRGTIYGLNTGSGSGSKCLDNTHAMRHSTMSCLVLSCLALRCLVGSSRGGGGHFLRRNLEGLRFTGCTTVTVQTNG